MTVLRDRRTRGSRRFKIETPEHVSVEFEVAGLGSRAVALLVDAVIVVIAVSLLTVILALLPSSVSSNWVLALLMMVFFAVPWGYFTLFEWLLAGKTPGKRYAGIRVISLAGHMIDFRQSVVRNLVRLVDAQPGFAFFFGGLFVVFQRHSRRLGDMAAGTVVVHDRPSTAPTPPSSDEVPAANFFGDPVLSDEEFRLLQQYVERKDSMRETAHASFVAKLVKRFRDRLPEQADPDAALDALAANETAVRQARAGRGLRKASFGAGRREHWNRLAVRLKSMRVRGARGLTGKEVLELAASYRSAASDLARARTYHADEGTTEHLNLLVGAGHNFLYAHRAAERRTRGALLRDLLAEFYRSRVPILAAFSVFALPGIIGFAAMRADPSLAERVLPAEMVSRAELGLINGDEAGYAEAPNTLLPMVASGIIANNIQVSFAAFAFGMTAGIGTLFLLAFNGLFFGAVVGLFSNYDLALWLLTFVVGHGPLELTAIFIAGGAGLILGRAIIAPGDFSRYDALYLAGRRAFRLVGLSALFLVLAGSIEGFVSASGSPAALKLGIGVASTALIVLLFVRARALANTNLQ